MSRPDAIHFRNTNQLSSRDFLPARLMYHGIPRWVGLLLLAQWGLGSALWLGLHTDVAHQRLPALLGTRVANFVCGVGVHPVMSFAGSQLAVMLMLQLTAVPLIRHALRHHAAGLKELFQSIHSMSNGLTPKALVTGRPGEIGYLALAFNDMIARLLANRKELMEANESLEKRVAERTKELCAAAEKLEKMARIDALTGLFNRRALMDEGDAKFAMASREGGDVVCMLVDLDNFKGVNDTLGHAKGDALICAAAESLRGCCRPYDVVARLGGDEFVVLMMLEDLDVAVAIAQRLQEDFGTRSTNVLAGATLAKKPSMSIGITSRKHAKSSTLEQLMAHADDALYQAKDEGKGRSHVYRAAPAAAA
jgi:diguanylate cyclase (GGDEF)-like protein